MPKQQNSSFIDKNKAGPRNKKRSREEALGKDQTTLTENGMQAKKRKVVKISETEKEGKVILSRG